MARFQARSAVEVGGLLARDAPRTVRRAVDNVQTQRRHNQDALPSQVALDPAGRGEDDDAVRGTHEEGSGPGGTGHAAREAQVEEGREAERSDRDHARNQEARDANPREGPLEIRVQEGTGVVYQVKQFAPKALRYSLIPLASAYAVL